MPGRAEVAAGPSRDGQALGKRDPGFRDLGELREVQSDESRVCLPGAARQRDAELSARAGDREVVEVEPQPAVGAAARRETLSWAPSEPSAPESLPRSQRSSSPAMRSSAQSTANRASGPVASRPRTRAARSVTAPAAGSGAQSTARPSIASPSNSNSPAVKRTVLAAPAYGAGGDAGERERGDRHGTAGAIHRPSLPPRHRLQGCCDAFGDWHPCIPEALIGCVAASRGTWRDRRSRARRSNTSARGGAAAIESCPTSRPTSISSSRRSRSTGSTLRRATGACGSTSWRMASVSSPKRSDASGPGRGTRRTGP